MFKKIWNKLKENFAPLAYSFIIFIIWLVAKEQRVIYSVIVSLFSLSLLPVLCENNGNAESIKATSKGKRAEAMIKLATQAILLSTALFAIAGEAILKILANAAKNNPIIDYYFFYFILSIVFMAVSLIFLIYLQKFLYHYAKKFKWLETDSSNEGG